MKEQKQPFSRDEIHNFTKPLLEEMVIRLLDQIDSLNGQIAELTERINVLLSNQYGRKTERSGAADIWPGTKWKQADGPGSGFRRS